jgi:hypothetical protein
MFARHLVPCGTIARGLSAICSRSLMSKAAPGVPIADIKASLRRSGTHGLGHRLTPTDRETLNDGKRFGALRLTQEKTDSICTAYMRYCWATQRPYIVVDNYGVKVHVDANPVVGNSSSPQTASLEKLVSSWAPVLAQYGASISNNETVAKQPSKVLPGPREGSNNYGGKVPDNAPSAVFTVHTDSRSDAYAVAGLLYSSYCTTFGLALPSDFIVASATAKRDAAALRRVRMLRRLRALDASVQSGSTILRTRQGVLAGFRAWNSSSSNSQAAAPQ